MRLGMRHKLILGCPFDLLQNAELPGLVLKLCRQTRIEVTADQRKSCIDGFRTDDNVGLKNGLLRKVMNVCVKVRQILNCDGRVFALVMVAS